MTVMRSINSSRDPRRGSAQSFLRAQCRPGSACRLVLLFAALVCGACAEHEKPYGTERGLYSTLRKRQVWAVAPAVNLSGQSHVDALLQADLLYQQLQQVQGLTIVPVNRVAELYATLRIERVQSEKQAQLVCDLLGCEGLLVPTVTAFDPYNPPKVGASLQLFV